MVSSQFVIVTVRGLLYVPYSIRRPSQFAINWSIAERYRHHICQAELHVVSRLGFKEDILYGDLGLTPAALFSVLNIKNNVRIASNPCHRYTHLELFKPPICDIYGMVPCLKTQTNEHPERLFTTWERGKRRDPSLNSPFGARKGHRRKKNGQPTDGIGLPSHNPTRTGHPPVW